MFFPLFLIFYFLCIFTFHISSCTASKIMSNVSLFTFLFPARQHSERFYMSSVSAPTTTFSYRKVGGFHPCHTGDQWQSWDSNPVICLQNLKDCYPILYLIYRYNLHLKIFINQFWLYKISDIIVTFAYVQIIYLISQFTHFKQVYLEIVCPRFEEKFLLNVCVWMVCM